MDWFLYDTGLRRERVNSIELAHLMNETEERVYIEAEAVFSVLKVNVVSLRYIFMNI